MTRRHGIDHLIGPYLYGDVSAKERATVESHLVHCATCRAEVEALQRLVDEVPRDIFNPNKAAASRVLQGLESEIAAERRLLPSRRVALGPIVALAAAAAFALGLWIGCRLPRERPASPAGVAIERRGPLSARSSPVARAETKGGIAGMNEAAPVKHNAPPSNTGQRVVSPPRPVPHTLPEQTRPPAIVQMARAESRPMFAPNVLGLDDVTLTSVSQN